MVGSELQQHTQILDSTGTGDWYKSSVDFENCTRFSPSNLEEDLPDLHQFKRLGQSDFPPSLPICSIT